MSGEESRFGGTKSASGKRGRPRDDEVTKTAGGRAPPTKRKDKKQGKVSNQPHLGGVLTRRGSNLSGKEIYINWDRESKSATCADEEMEQGSERAKRKNMRRKMKERKPRPKKKNNKPKGWAIVTKERFAKQKSSKKRMYVVQGREAKKMGQGKEPKRKGNGLSCRVGECT